jgi:hypothetical protein
MLESMISNLDTNEQFKVQGISGTISTGFKIQSIKWGAETNDAGEIGDVRVKYNNFWELLGGRRIVFREVSVGKAHLDVTGLEQLFSESNSVAIKRQNRANANPVWANRTSQRSSTPKPDLVQIDRIAIEDVFITNRVTGLGLTIPSLQWTGFKSANGKVELGQLEIDSDRLKVTTKEGRTVDVDGRQLPFQKLLEGTVLPAMHKSIRRPISFTVDVASDHGKLSYRVMAFDGGLDLYRAPGQDGFLRCKQLDLTSYIDAAVPRQLTCSAVWPAEDDSNKSRLKLGAGSFKLGVKTFDIQPVEIERTDDTEGSSQTNRLTALSRSGNEEFTYELLVGDRFWNLQQRLSVRPLQSPQETLAKVFVGKPYAQLDAAQREEIDRKLPAFGAGTNKVLAEKQ